MSNQFWIGAGLGVLGVGLFYVGWLLWRTDSLNEELLEAQQMERDLEAEKNVSRLTDDELDALINDQLRRSGYSPKTKS